MAWVPSAARGSAAKPASNATCTETTGTAARRAKTTFIPLDSVARSICGNWSAASWPIGGSSLRSGPVWVGAGTGAAGTGALGRGPGLCQ
jgi:hypothetical protein